MSPPYDPAHPETVTFADSKTHAVVAHCGCGWSGRKHVLTPAGGVARLLADDFNAHRGTYIAAA